MPVEGAVVLLALAAALAPALAAGAVVMLAAPLAGWGSAVQQCMQV
jgi:hypothetical protein